MWFQSTLPRRERLAGLCYSGLLGGSFNPRSHAGSDPRGVELSVPDFVSIHAPTQGATFNASVQTGGASAFQSTLPRRERPLVSLIEVTMALFQSTLPRRERPGGLVHIWESNEGFNPRSHAGSDHPDSMVVRGADVSIHAPTQGATVKSS